MFLLDTNVCIAWLNGSSDRLRAHLKAQEFEAIFLCTVVQAELFYGAQKSDRVQENLDRLA